MRHNLLLNRSRGTASLQPLVLLAIIVVMTGAQAVLVPGSLTVEQMLIISRQASALGIITLGQGGGYSGGGHRPVRGCHRHDGKHLLHIGNAGQ